MSRTVVVVWSAAPLADVLVDSDMYLTMNKTPGFSRQAMRSTGILVRKSEYVYVGDTLDTSVVKEQRVFDSGTFTDATIKEKLEACLNAAVGNSSLTGSIEGGLSVDRLDDFIDKNHVTLADGPVVPVNQVDHLALRSHFVN